MQPELTVPDTAPKAPGIPVPGHWRSALYRLGVAWAAIFALTWRAWFEMLDKWWNISTYNHVLFVPAIIGWLIWTRREEVLALSPRAWWPGLILLACALFGWLVGHVAGVNTLSQLGAVLSLQAAVLAVLGPTVGLGLLFPLAYMVFLVPFGDELVPALQMITADLVIAMTEWSGIPAQIDGVFINTPAGLFEVAEACSGVKFLIAMTALGTLVAHSCFKSWTRRVIFMAAAIAVPIIANGIRAWGTIYIAQSQGIEFAAGFDHIFYGWIFFALVVVLLLGIAWHFFDREPEDPAFDPAVVQQSRLLALIPEGSIPVRQLMVAGAIMLAIITAWSVAPGRIEADLPRSIALPNVPGWERVTTDNAVLWEPRANGADHRLLGQYRHSSGQRVDVFVALYGAQEEGREATAPGEGALRPDTPWRWLAPAPSGAQASGQYLLAEGNVKRIALTSFAQGNDLTGSAALLKLYILRDRLLLKGRPTSMLIVSAETTADQDAAETIADFQDATGPAKEWLDRIVGGG